MRNVYLYLSGNVNNSNSGEDRSCWTENDLDSIQALLVAKGLNAVFLNTTSYSSGSSDDLFGRGALQVYLSDCLLVNNRQRRGIGVGYEMALANQKGVPVVCWTSLGSQYKAENNASFEQGADEMMHPFLSGPSAKTVENLEEAVDYISTYCCGSRLDLKSEDYVASAIFNYVTTQLDSDLVMKKIIDQSPVLVERIEKIKLLGNTNSAVAWRDDSPVSDFIAQPVRNGFPVQVIGLDVKTVSEKGVEKLNDLLDKHSVLVLRGMDLTEEEQVCLTKMFGQPGQAWDPKHRNKQYPEVQVIRNWSERENNAYLYDRRKISASRHWHSDQSFMNQPTRITMLHVKLLPEVGGDTLFINTENAYQALPSDMKEKIENMTAVHSFDYFFWKLLQERGQDKPGDFPEVTHPLVRNIDGRKSLYMSELVMKCISGLSEAENEKILTQLYEHCKKESFRYTHKWKEGDILIWDNFRLMHKATFTDPQYKRTLNRTTVLSA